MADGEQTLSYQELREAIGGWAKATFKCRAESIRYHYVRHGTGQGVLQYTRQARQFYRVNRHRARMHLLETGEVGLKIDTRMHFGIYTTEGKIVSHGRQ